MNESNDASGERTDTEQGGEAAENGHQFTRRGILATSLAAGGLALGGSTPALAKSKVAEDCTGDMTQMDVENGTFVLINNDWSAPVADGVDQCVYRYDDGSFGWSWDRNGEGAGNGPNYPQICLGNKPWGDVATDTDLFPVQRGDVSEFEAALDFDVDVTAGDEWNLALEWWLTESMPEAGTDLGSEITHEIMLVCEWGSGHDHGTPIESSAVEDSYGNTIDYWTHYEDHGSGWSFHIFRVAANSCPSQVDLTAIQDYLDASVTDTYEPFDDSYWVTGVEIGDEYWEYTTGQTEGYQYDVTLNGATETSGSGGSSSDTTAPAAPSNLTVTDTTTSEVSLGWDSVSDAAHYNVYVDGSYDHQTTSTSTTVGSLSSDTSYQFGVSAVDDAGNESTTTTVTASTDASSTNDSVVHAINTGGSSYSASDGTSYEADTYYSNGNTSSSSDPIANTDDDALYQTERWGDPVTYELPVADGTYDVELHFAEIYWEATGERVFDVTVEGSTVLSDVDLYDRVGHDAALVETVTGVDISDGYLTVDMSASTDNAKLAAVRVLEASSSGGDSTDDTAPAEPSNLTVTDTTTSDVSLDWDAVSDAAHYNVYVDGSYDSQTTNTSATVSGLGSDTSYQFGVSAVDDAGNESTTATVTASTDAESTDDTSSDGLTVNDYDGDPAWSGTNDLGEWCGAGSLENGGGGEGEVVDGALRLDYDGGGWLQSYVSQDVSGYDTVNLRVRGDNGGEESEFALELGDTGDVLANLTSDTIGTSFSTVSVNLADNGLATDLGDVYLDFWAGDYAASALEVDEIWFE